MNAVLFNRKYFTILLKAVFMLTLLFGWTSGWSQSLESQKTKSENFTGHRLTVLMANSFIPAADNLDGQNPIFIVPTWGINYDFWFNPKIGLGLHNDVVLQQYKIEKSSDAAIVERSFPVIISGVFLFKPFKKWTILIGGGRELEKHASFTLINAGLEYGIELPHEWELNLNLIYDNKIDAYDSWMFGVGFSRLFHTEGKR